MEEELGFGFEESGDAAELPETAPAEIVSEEEEDFEFAFSIDSDPGAYPDTTADEIFYKGRILPVYPVFNRDLIEGSADELMMEYKKRDMRSGLVSSSSSIVSEAKDVERLSTSAPATFVPPSPDRWRKSSSTGSSASASAMRKWKLRDLVVGRSRSDGKERFVVIPFPDEKEKEKKEKKALRSSFHSFAKSASAEVEKKEKGGKGKGEAAKEMDIVTAHRIYYGKVGSGGGQPAAAGSSRRSFLPYRQELLGGIFGNSKHHPF